MKLKYFNYKSVNSTNDVAIKIIKNTNNKFGIVVTETQKRGKGQYGKKWISYKGNLFVSIFFTFDKVKLSLRQMTRVNCYLVKRLISNYCKKNISIKLPNDLMIGKKKICGILQETINKADKKFMVVGIGINLIKSPNISNYPTTSIFEITKKKNK